MSNIKHTVLFEDFGLDLDTANRYMQNGSSPYFLNVLKGEEGAYGELTNMEGNRVIKYELGDSNTYFVLMSCYDPLTRNTYYYIFSQPFDVTGSGDYEYDNRLIRFNEDSEVIDTIFYDPKNYLGFDPTKLIKDSFVLGDWLYINPRESEPKMLHIEMLLNYTKALKGLDRYSIYDETLDYLYGDKVAYFGGIFLATTTVAVGETPITDTDKWERIGDCYQDETDIEFDSEFRYAFNVIKHIPISRPICSYGSDLDKNANNVRGKLFRFSHRYKYFDNSYSRYSAFSDVTLPIYDEYYNGEVPGDLDEFNYINVVIPTHSAALIKEIDIIFQETGGVWKRAKIINRRDIDLLGQLYYTYKFYNTDSAYEVIDDTFFYEPYDSVPKKSNSQELINKNILCYGGPTEGFNNIDKNLIDVTLLPEIEAIDIEDLVGTIIYDNYNTEGGFSILWGGEEFNWYFTTTIYIGSWFIGALTAGDILKVVIGGRLKIYVITALDAADLITCLVSIRNFLDDNFPVFDWTYDANNIITIGDDFPSITTFVFYTPAGHPVSALTKARGFKTGAWHPFCIYYYDEAMRRWDAQTSKDNISAADSGTIPLIPLLNEDGTPLLNEDGSPLYASGGSILGGAGFEAYEMKGTTVYIPMLNEVSPVPMTTANRWILNWGVGHLPPKGAKWWRWGYSGNALCSEFVQYIIEDIGNVGVSSASEPINTTWINIKPLQTIKFSADTDWNKFPNSIIEPWQYTKGDRVRIITEKNTEDKLGNIIDGVYDYEILEEKGDDYKIYIQVIDYNTLGIGEDSLIEIYRPKRSETASSFFEFGELMPIIEDSEGIFVHGCGTIGLQNQDTGLNIPAIGVFEAGDVYHILRTPSKPIDTTDGYFHESQWYSDFYDSDDWDKGRIGVETSFGERTLNIVRYSNQYLQNTLINGLSTFNGADYIEFNDMFGAIMRIIEIGDTLKVYQRKKPSSVPIGRTQYFDAAGNANVEVQSDRVFGAVNYSNTDYGTEFPESISLNNRYVYGFDIYNGVMWRDAANGLFPISGRWQTSDGAGDYKMETYFKDKAKALLVSGIEGVNVLTVWDERHHNLYVVFKDIVTSANNDAVVFHEPSNRWICFTEMDQTKEEGWNMPIELDYWITKGFDGGIGYLFDEDTRFATFHVVASASIRDFASRQNMTMELFTPSATSSCDAPLDRSNLTITPLTPSSVSSYVWINEASLSWLYDEYGKPHRKTTLVNCFPSPARLTAIPSWISVARIHYNELGLNDYIYDGDVINIWPKEENLGNVKTDAPLTIGNIGYTDTDSVLLSQGSAVVWPVVTVVVAGDNPSGVTLSALSGIASPGETDVLVMFTIFDTRYAVGAVIPIYYTATIDGGDIDSFGHSNTVNSQANSIGIILNNIAYSGSTVLIELRGVILGDQSIGVGLQELTMTPYTPNVIISECSATVTSFVFDYDENSRAEAIIAGHQTVITASSSTNQAVITSMPNWIVIWSETYSVALYKGDTIDNGDTLTIYPKLNNSEYIQNPPLGYNYVTMASTSDSSLTLTLSMYQEANPVLPVGQVLLPAGVIIIHSAVSDYLSLIDDSYVVWGLSLDNEIKFYIKGIKNTLVNYLDYFTIYYRVDITRGGVTTIDSVGEIIHVRCSLDSDNYIPVHGTSILSSTTVAGDVVTLYFSIYEF